MLQLVDVLEAWGTPSFEAILKQELSRQVDRLPLQQALAFSSSVAETPITIILRGMVESDTGLCVCVGIFFHGLTGGCNCADDPSPQDEANEYCQLQLDIDKMTAVTTITLLD